MIATDSDFNILIIESNSEDYTIIQNHLSKGFKSPGIFHAKTFAQGQKKIKSDSPIDLVLLNVSSFDNHNECFLADLKALCALIPVIVLADSDNQDFASQTMAFGVFDYLLTEELSASQLYKSITYTIERDKNLKKLRESEERYKSLFQLTPLSKFIYDSKTLEFLDVNEAAIKHYGYSREEFLTMTALDIRPPEEHKTLRKALEEYADQGIVRKKSFKHLKKNGEVIDVEVESNEIIFEGRPSRLVLSLDVTERVQAEKALRASEKRFKSLIQEGVDLISIISAEGVVKYLSPNHEMVFGYKMEELYKLDPLAIIHPDDVEQFSKNIGEKKSFSMLMRAKDATGNWLWIESIWTDANDDDAINGYIINSRNVTARVESEKNIRESNKRFEAVAKATSDAIYDYDFKTQEIYIAGSNYHTLFGYEFDNQITDVDFFKSRIHPEEKENIFEFLKKTVENQKKSHFEMEYRFMRSDGTFANILDRFDIIWDNGVPVRKVGAMQDISTRKLQETILSFEKEIYELNANPKISFEFVIDKLVSNIEALLPDSHCTILALTEEQTVKHIAGKNINSNYIQAIEKMVISPASGSCGTALYTGKSVFSENLDEDPLWYSFRDIIKPHNYKSCWSVPVKKRTGKTIATFAAYFKTNKSPKKEEINLMERATNLIGILIENRNAFEETETAKERYDIVAKATSDTIWDWKIQDDQFVWNKGIQGVFGYKKDEVGKTSKWWFDRVHPEDSIRVSVKLYNFIEEKVEKWQDEYRFACADGTYKHVYDRGFLVKDKDGKPIRMIASMQDVTKQKQEEQRLKLLETVITQTKDSVIITEAEKSSNSIPKIVFVNPAFSQMTGYKASDVVGKSPAIFMGKKSIAEEITKLSEAFKTRKEFKFETLNNKKNGEEYWVNFSMIPITNKEGDHSHWISIQRDITEEKKQEKEKEQLIRELTQNNKDLKQFSYITSHNLRAPLSNLTGLLNLMEDIPVENEELKEILNGFSKSTHLLNETINDLVKVVIIKDNPSIQKEEVLIQDVFENVFNQLSFLISMHKPIIKIELAKVSILNINKAYLESILLNLLTNAIKYRSPTRQLKIYVSSKEVGNNITLVFKDNGIGIDLHRNADKIFGLYQRFHNYPDSKGLGLYLVKSQVETMGGTITVQSEVNKGTTFTLTFKNK